MEKGYIEAINSLGEVILQQKTQLKFKEYELETVRKELDKLKAKMKAIEDKCNEYVS